MTGLLLVASGVFAEEALPPPGFLEFLGTMVETEGEFLDPLSMATATEQVLMEETEASEQTKGAGEVTRGKTRSETSKEPDNE